MKSLKTLLVGGTMLASTPALAADIVIGVPNWPSVKAAANILKVAVEDNLGLEVELQNGTNPIVFEAMDSGAMHIHPEVWLPNQQNLADQFAKEKGTVVINENGVSAFQGMCMDRASAEANGITSIDDLTNPDVAALIDRDGDGQGELWIGAPGWASTNVEQIRAKSYGYDQTMELVQTDETIAYAELDSAIEAGEPWIGFCYGPHYVFALHDLVVLDEPEHDPAKWNVAQPTDDPDWLENSDAAVSWPPIYIHMAYAKSLESDYPAVSSMLSNVDFDTDTVSNMTYQLVIEGKEAPAFAQEWVAANEDQVLGWFLE
ncbi:glycine betaine ABC transporter substrate-binding protein [uncultured Roseovarius sp.]|uniref:ABC transporter substrate-binding protein n=1 Tax=uncultured Roseovarius sp. TaxID=293344 RepID=UPI0025D267B8|nr:glycine betaine ABC transporter substrate-binding protein [uncultured Roseovarius sp.]